MPSKQRTNLALFSPVRSGAAPLTSRVAGMATLAGYDEEGDEGEVE